MRKNIICFIFLTFLIFSVTAEISYLDRGYLTLSDASNWNDYYVTYQLITDNSKGGTSKTTFVKDSFDKVLSSYYYDSKDYFNLSEQEDELYDQNVLYLPYLSTWDAFNQESDIFKKFKDLSPEIIINPDADNIIEEEFNLAKEDAKKTYHQTVDNCNKLTQDQRDLLTGDWFKGSSGIEVTWKRFVDSHDGYFVFKIYQKETNTTTYFRIYDTTQVYFKTTGNNNERNYSTLDEKVLAICSEISANTKIRFGILKSNNLKDYKTCNFVIIGE